MLEALAPGRHRMPSRPSRRSHHSRPIPPLSRAPLRRSNLHPGRIRVPTRVPLRRRSLARSLETIRRHHSVRAAHQSRSRPQQSRNSKPVHRLRDGCHHRHHSLRRRSGNRSRSRRRWMALAGLIEKLMGARTRIPKEARSIKSIYRGSSRTVSKESAATFVSVCRVPDGHSISTLSARALRPSPKCTGSSLEHA